jgi:hypothetical protein
MADMISTIETYAAEVCKRLGRQYSLYSERAIEVLPEAIRQTLIKGEYLPNELTTVDGNGTIIDERVVTIPATPEYAVYIDNNNPAVLQILNVILNARSSECLVSEITAGQHFAAASMSYDSAIDHITYYMDSNHILIQNPLAKAYHVTIAIRRTQFQDTVLSDTTTNLCLYFSYNLLLQIIAAAVEILKSEITL